MGWVTISVLQSTERSVEILLELLNFEETTILCVSVCAVRTDPRTLPWYYRGYTINETVLSPGRSTMCFALPSFPSATTANTTQKARYMGQLQLRESVSFFPFSLECRNNSFRSCAIRLCITNLQRRSYELSIDIRGAHEGGTVYPLSLYPGIVFPVRGECKLVA